MFSVGMIGYSWAASAHIPAIQACPEARVTAVCSSRRLDDAELSARWGTPIRTFTDLDEMLALPDLNVVSICSLPNLHCRQAIAAARAGKHIILEKPIALSWEDCLAVEEAVTAAGVKVCVCFECRFSSQFQAIRSVIEAGLLGQIHYAEVDYYHGIGPWYGQYRWNILREQGGSALLTAGCHALDALLFCQAGIEVEDVQSISVRSKNDAFARYEYPTTSVTLLRFGNGSVGKCAASIDCLQPYYFHTHLVGSEGSLLDNKFYSGKLAGLDKNRWSSLSFHPLDSGDVSDHPYRTQFARFFQSLQRGEDMPHTALRDAMDTHRIIFLSDAAAEKKCR